MADNQVTTRVSYRLDEQSVKRVVQSADDINIAFQREGEGAADVAKRMADYLQAKNEAAEGSRALETALIQERNALQQNVEAQTDLQRTTYGVDEAKEREIQLLDTEQKELQESTKELETYTQAKRAAKTEGIVDAPALQQAQSRRTASRRGAIGQIGRAIVAAPAIGASTPIGRGLIGLDTIMQKTGATSLQLAGSMGLVAPVAIALGIAVDTLKQQLKEAKESLEAALSAQNNYYDAVRTLTSAQAQEEIETRRRANQVLQQQIEETNAALESAFAQSAAALSDPLARLLDNQTPVADLRAQLEDLQKQFRENEGTATRLTQGLEGNAFAFNDAAEAAEAAAEAEKLLTEERQNFLDQLAEQTQEEIRIRRIRRGSSDDILRELEDARDRATVLREQWMAAQADPDMFPIDELNALRQQYDDQRGTVFDLARRYEDAVAREKELLGIQIEADRLHEEMVRHEQELIDKAHQLSVAFKEAAIAAEELRQAGIKSAVDELFEAQEKLVSAQIALTKSTNELREAEQKALEKRDEILRDRDDRLAEIEATAGDKLVENAAKNEEQRQKVIDQSNKRILDITRKANAMIANAVGSRDALAAYLARQNAKQQIADEQDARKERLEELDKALQEQNEQVKKRQDEQTKQVIKAAEERLRIEAARAREEIAKRRQAAQQALVDLTNAQNAELLTRKQHSIMMVNEARNAGTQMVNAFKMSMTNALEPFLLGRTSSAPAPGRPNINDIPFAFTKPQQAPQLNLNVQGATTKHIQVTSAREANAVWNSIMKEMGMG